MSRPRVTEYFELLVSILQENDIMTKPGHIYNMDESGLQLCNKATQVIATKGSKQVSSITLGEKGETITVIACCNAEGTFLPPVFIMKGKNKKAEYEDEQFLPRKPPGKVLLLVNGHASHHSSGETLEYADENDVIILSLPSHTTHFLQPLDRAVFKSLKSAWNNVCNKWMRSNSSRKISRLQFGTLISEAWAKAATTSNAISAFKSTGIYPYDPDIIPDYAYLIDENAENRQHDGMPAENQKKSDEARVCTQPELPFVPSTLAEPIAGPSSRPDNPFPNEVLKKSDSDSEISSEEIVYQDSDEKGSEDECCTGCGEEYSATKKKDDWIQCLYCKTLYHENCSKYINVCDLCGKLLSKKK
ncbi:uncharacterized protein LOC126736773 [Anthonomus grandis grandis]|uniref:uncharacterized protein LOC126736773 n=1 Tax=Anthonomus grandis grandis TaxID=2921223 RepID=UPI002165E9DA|nr:uncharacterized protein LOC126736773 [Anthonomus grandis grandis]